jgi:hypothetical protein
VVFLGPSTNVTTPSLAGCTMQDRFESLIFVEVDKKLPETDPRFLGRNNGFTQNKELHIYSWEMPKY